MLYRVMYCCKAPEALGLPLCIICVSRISSFVSILDVQKAAWPKSTSLAQRHIEISCCVVQAHSKERVRSDPLKEFEQHNNLYQYGALQVKSIWKKQPSEHPKLRRKKICSIHK